MRSIFLTVTAAVVLVAQAEEESQVYSLMNRIVGLDGEGGALWGGLPAQWGNTDEAAYLNGGAVSTHRC